MKRRWKMTRAEYAQRQREMSARGERLPWAKLDAAAVREARETYERARFAIAHINEHYSIAGLAKKYGVSVGAMEKALNYSTWRHVA